MSNSGDEWELSKENIQPLQQGRKPEVLKHALQEHPVEDPIQLQRQAFENELRTYSGDDPLSVWCKYICWVEQNFPKGGRDGHLEQLMQKCISILKEERKYYDDKRFIVILLKFANASTKPIEVYNYMYSNNIGCRSASFFISWSWELEQQGNIQKANTVLQEGINRNADPIEKIKLYFSEFEMRISRKVMESDQNADQERHRSAFTMLKPHKNTAPVVRIGDSVLEQNRAGLIIGRQQPAPKSNVHSSKVPFKIFNAKVTTPSLPLQSAGTVPFVLHSDRSKENELKPSKWNKVKAKQMVPVNRPIASTDIGFNFHCDEAPQPISTPRSVPKVSDILRVRQTCKSPPIALFEPPDPMKRPMYDKNKVYGGAEEYSLEEIRAAAWLEKHGQLKADQKTDEQAVVIVQNIPNNTRDSQTKVGFKIHSDDIAQSSHKPLISNDQSSYKPLISNVPKNASNALPLWHGCENPVRALFSPRNSLKCPIYDRNKIYNGPEEFSFEEIRASTWFEKQHKLKTDKKVNEQQNILEIKKDVKSLPDDLKYCKDSVAGTIEVKRELINEQDKYFSQELLTSHGMPENNHQKMNGEKNLFMCNNHVNYSSIFSDSFPHSDLENKQATKESAGNTSALTNMPTESYFGVPSVTDILLGKCPTSTSYCEAANMLQEFCYGAIANLPNSTNEEIICKENYKSLDSSNNMIYSDLQDMHSSMGPFCAIPVKTSLPFTLYQDPLENNCVTNNDIQQTSSVFSNNVPNSVKSDYPFNFYQDPIDNNKSINQIMTPMATEQSAQILSTNNADICQTGENLENIPPNGYVQEMIKRDMSGILTPSKNIMYVPLELQELEDNSDSDDICMDNDYASRQDITLIPPCNTEQFASAKFYSSTPCAAAKNRKKSNLQISATSNTNNCGSETGNVCVDNINMGPPQSVAENVTLKQGARAEKSVFVSRPISSLSVIMETSKESYKSSASSGSSASATKFSQLDQCCSYDKSSTTQKEFSRVVEAFKEPKPVTQGFDLAIANQATVDFVRHSIVGQTPPKLFVSDIDPFSDRLTEKLLQSLSHPPGHHKSLEICEKSFRTLKVNDVVDIKGVSYIIENIIAEGAYGKVYLSEKQSNLSQHDISNSFHTKFALKVCKNTNEWELYICSTLHERLLQLNKTPDVRLSAMEIIAAKKCGRNMILVDEYSHQGTLLDLVNFYKKQNGTVPEYLAMYLTLEMLQTVSAFHECKIVHADVKPDNILLRDNIFNNSPLETLGERTSFLKFIDFGRSIDLGFFEDGICFSTPLKSRCIELLEDKPWVFQPDWYGVLDCVYTLLFSDYMKVQKSASGKWETVKRFRRYWATDIWVPLFDELLNLSGCYEEHKINKHVANIQTKLQQQSNNFNLSLANLRNFYTRKPEQ